VIASDVVAGDDVLVVQENVAPGLLVSKSKVGSSPRQPLYHVFHFPHQVMLELNTQDVPVYAVTCFLSNPAHSSSSSKRDVIFQTSVFLLHPKH